VLTQADIDAGGIANSALVSGKDPEGRAVSDVSDDGDDADGNTTDDATEVNIPPAAGLVVVKHLDSIGKAAGEEAVFTITATNTGNLVLSNVGVTDDLSRIDGIVLPGPTPAFQSNSAGSPQGILAPAETATWTVHYVLTQADVDAGGISNQAVVAANTPLGGTISDQSDDDGNGDSDPSIGLIGATPGLAVVKSVNTPSILFPTVEQATFTIAVQNTGNITQSHIGLVDDLTGFLAPATLDPDYPITVLASGFGAATANPDYNGSTVTQTLAGDATLLPGQTGQVQITVTYSTVNGSPGGENIALATSREHPTPAASNPVSVPETDSDGDGVSDAEEGSGDRDGDGIPNDQDYDPTGAFYCEDTGQLMSGGLITVTGPSGSQSGVGSSNRITIVRDGSDGRFQFYVTQAGTYTLAISYPPGTQASTTRMPGGALDLTSLLPANPASLGAGEVGTTGKLGDFSAGANPFYLTFVIEAGDPHIFNNNIPLLGCHGGENVVASKSADRSTAVFGETVNFTLTFENTSAVTYPAAHVVDLLPEGLIYTPGSATVNGVAQEPVVTGRQLDFAAMTMAPADKITVQLAARVQAQSIGELTNQTWLQDINGAQISNRATATVRIQPEAVFECSDVIGKVFDDVNHNGYPDGREGPPPLTNDDVYTGGKYGKPNPVPKDYEPGLAGVRLATVNGLLITTDKFGRFHVPCAALPKSDGSNFILKVDPRSLPLGYQMTTENPRVLRLTPGKVAKMNFGAALANVLDINLTAKAFAAGEDKPNAAFAKAVKDLVRDIKATPTVLHLSYLLAKGEDVNLANARLKAAEGSIRKAWRGIGAYDLEIARDLRQVK
jgi:uncharacterized repeat protein (TIGR01451 family)